MEFVVPLVLLAVWYGISPSIRERLLTTERNLARTERDLAVERQKAAELRAEAMHAHLGPIEELVAEVSREATRRREAKHGPRSLHLLNTEEGRLERMAAEAQCKIARAREACPR